MTSALKSMKRKARRGAILAMALLGGCAGNVTAQNPYTVDTDESDFAAYVSGAFAESINDPSAADFLLRASSQNPGNRAILSRAFIALLTEGRIDEAVKAARRLQTDDRTYGLASVVLALDAFKARRYAETRGHLSGLSNSGFEMLIAPILTAWSLAAEGEKVAALAALAPMGAVPSLRPFAAAHRAFLLDYLKDQEAADQAYQEALRATQISSLQPVVSYAALLQRMGRKDDALAMLDQYLTAFAGNAFLDRAKDNILDGVPVKQIAATPEGAVSLLLFRAADELDRDESRRPAIVYARLASYLSPGLDDARIRLAGMLTDAEHYASALDILRSIDRKAVLYDTAQLQAAYIHQQAGDAALAVKTIEHFLASRPESVRGWSTLGDIHRGQEDFEKAIGAYTKAINLSTDESEIAGWYLYFVRGIAHERHGDFDKAEADLKASLERNPDEAQVLNYLGYSWIDRGVHLEEGTRLIERAVALKPGDGFIIDSLGWAYFLRGDYGEAVRHLERAVELEPSDPTLNDHLGDAYWKVGRRTEARFQWSHALAAGAEEKNAALIREKLLYGLELAEAGPPPEN